MKHFLLLVLFIAQGCASYHPTPEYITLLDKMTVKFNKDICQEHRLSCSGYGGSLMTDISGVSLHYCTVGKCDVPTCRRQVVACVQKLQTMINADEKLHPFLHESPFPANRIKFSVLYLDKKGNFFSDGSLTCVSVRNGKIYYSKDDLETGLLEDLWEEDYTEALRIVESEDSAKE